MRIFSDELKAERKRRLFAHVTSVSVGAGVGNPVVSNRSESDESTDAGQAEPPDGTRTGPTPEQLQLLVLAAARPQSFLMELYERLGVPFRVGRRLLTELEAHGLVRVRKLVRTGRGARPCVVEVLEAGALELQRHGLPKPANKGGRGEFLHWVYCRFLAAGSLFAGCEVSFEALFGSKISDLLGRHSDGRVIAGEVICSGSLAHNTRAMQRAMQVAGLTGLVIACEEQKMVSRLEARLSPEAAPNLFQTKVRVVFLGSCVAEVLNREVSNK